jgi:hypothetical protein
VNELIPHILESVSLCIGIAGIAVVTWGAIKALVSLIRLEVMVSVVPISAVSESTFGITSVPTFFWASSYL